MPLYALGDAEPVIHPDAYIHPDAVVIGTVTIGAEASIWPGAVLRGDDGRIEVGPRTSVQDALLMFVLMLAALLLALQYDLFYFMESLSEEQLQISLKGRPSSGTACRRRCRPISAQLADSTN